MKIFKKHNVVKQNINQNVRDFITYIKIIKYKLKSLTTTQQRNYFFIRLKFNINQTITISTNIFVIRKIFATRATRIKNAFFARNSNNQNYQNN